MTHARPRALVTVLGALALLGAARPAGATPRFAARNGAPCALCHVNPSGGGLRTVYGRTVFERQRLTSPWLARAFGEDRSTMTVDPRIGSAIAVGSDLRAGYLYGRAEDGSTPLDSFFLMQADLYVAAELGRHATLYADYGAWGGFEAFALLTHNLREPASGGGLAEGGWSVYLKMGRFLPTYGLRLEEHSTYTREGFGFLSTSRDTGLELGLSRGRFLLQLSYLKGALTDQNPEGTGYARVEWIPRLGPLKVTVGASASFNDDTMNLNPAIQVPLELGMGVHQAAAGAHLGLSLGRFTWLAEADYVRAKSRADGVRGQALVTWQQLPFLPAQGIELQLAHEYWDPDLDLAMGRYTRAGASVELYPWDYTELKLIYRRTFAPEMSPLDGLQEALAFLHLYY